MNAYVYQAAMLCECCGRAARKRLDAEGKRPADVDAEYTYDSDEYPKGPYPDGGGEADSPQHCDACGLFLENDITGEGEAHIYGCIIEALSTGNVAECIREWIDHYGIGLSELLQHAEANIVSE